LTLWVVHKPDADGPLQRVAGLAALASPNILWVDLQSPDATEEAGVEAHFGIDVPIEHERAALEESARFYVEGDALVLNATIMARMDPSQSPKISRKSQVVQHRRETLTFIVTPHSLISVRNCPLRAFEINAGRASVSLNPQDGAGDILAALLESLVERAADYLAASAGELEDLNVRVLIGHKQVRLETILRRLGQMGSGASQTRDSLASLARLVRFCLAHAAHFGLPSARLNMLGIDIDTLQRQSDALKMDLTFALDATLGLVSARQNDTLKAMAIVTLIFVPPTLIASALGMNFEAMTIFKDLNGPWWAAGAMAASSLLIVSIARLGKWL
jgi:magnesium transporter